MEGGGGTRILCLIDFRLLSGNSIFGDQKGHLQWVSNFAKVKY